MTRVDEITAEVATRFRSFGGGKPGGIIAHALAKGSPVFAAGVDIEEVVRFILDRQASTEGRAAE